MTSGVVLLRGVVRGPEHEADCDVLAWKAAEHEPHGYSQFKVVGAPRHLPDGTYTVSFGGRMFPTTKRSGWWILETVGTHAELPVASRDVIEIPESGIMPDSGFMGAVPAVA